MRFLRFFVTCVCLGACSACFSKEAKRPFSALVIQEKGTCLGMHEEDARRVKGTLKTIAKCVGGARRITLVGAKHFSMAKFKKWCHKLPHKGIAVVYYSGKGADVPWYKEKWPLVQFGKEKMPVDLLAEMVHARGPRLSVVFADCYNSFVRIGSSEKPYYGKTLGPINDKIIRQEVREEWTSIKGTLILCSNRHGAYSTGIRAGDPSLPTTNYGAFTDALLLSLASGTCETDAYSTVEAVSELHDKVAFLVEQAVRGKRRQRPAYRIDLERDPWRPQ